MRRASIRTIASLPFLLLVGCVAPGSDPDPDTTESGIVRNDVAGGLPLREAPASNVGMWKAVMDVGGCTGTVLGPYTAITAAHCGPNTSTRLTWSNESLGGVVRTYVNPFIDDFRPAWWVAANAGRSDWPAMHDMDIIFSTELTPAFIASRKITPPRIDPTFTEKDLTTFYSVGVASSGQRDWGEVKFLRANFGSLTSNPRDGYLTRDGETKGLVQTRAGDSGGPTFGVRNLLPTVFVGTTQNASGGQEPTSTNTSRSTFGGDIAPMAYTQGMTINQRSTARLNADWTAARLNDIDDDGYSAECDPDSSVASTGSLARCANTRGQVWGTPREVPMAVLRCPDTHVIAGLRGRGGWFIDGLALLCRSDASEFWTDEAGSETGGSAYSVTCPIGQGMYKWDIWTAPSAGVTERLGALRPYCATSIWGPHTPKGVLGNESGNRAWGGQDSLYCDTTSALRGFVVRRDGGRWITSVAGICTPKP